MPYLIEILLPVTETFHRKTLDAIRGELTDVFGGVTIHANAPAEGLWRDGGDTERDRIMVVEVMTEELDHTWWAAYRKRLEKQLSQDEIVVRGTMMDRL